MPKLFDPLRALAALHATPHIVVDAAGGRRIALRHARSSRHADQRRADAILKRYERLMLMQMDVPPGHAPRTVQQLVASGRVRLANGRYVLAEGA